MLSMCRNRFDSRALVQPPVLRKQNSAHDGDAMQVHVMVIPHCVRVLVILGVVLLGLFLATEQWLEKISRSAAEIHTLFFAVVGIVVAPVAATTTDCHHHDIL